APRQLARITFSESGWLESNQRQQLFDSFACSFFLPIFERRNKRDVLGNGEVREQSRFLNHITGATAQPNSIPIRRGLFLNQNCAGSWRQQAIYQPQGRGLSTAGF